MSRESRVTRSSVSHEWRVTKSPVSRESRVAKSRVADSDPSSTQHLGRQRSSTLDRCGHGRRLVTHDSRLATTTVRSEALFAEAQRHLPGGVDSPVRAFKSVGGTPRFIARARGASVWDVDDNRYVDYLASWGPLIAGHAHPGVVAAIQEAATRGTSYGAPTEAEIELGTLVKHAFPSIDLVRFVSSGTEATMTAIRLARAFTGRDIILKFDGGYHGHAD